MDNKTDWILDTGASRHLCSNKELFHKLEDVAEGEYVFMGNSTAAGVLGSRIKNTLSPILFEILLKFWGVISCKFQGFQHECTCLEVCCVNLGERTTTSIAPRSCRISLLRRSSIVLGRSSYLWKMFGTFLHSFMSVDLLHVYQKSNHTVDLL